MIKELLYDSPAEVDPVVNTDHAYWQNRLQPRPYRFPATSESEHDLAVHLENAGARYFFPLGTPDVGTAAAKARALYEMATNEGWNTVCRHYSRELIVSFEWCMDPVLWTYTTIHTLVGGSPRRTRKVAPRTAHQQQVLVVEADAGIRQALCWGIDQQEGFASVACESVEAGQVLLGRHKPHLILLNRHLVGGMAFHAGAVSPFKQAGPPVITFSTHADGKQMFASAPGGAGGYLIKRVKADRLLEPILKVASRSELTSHDFLGRVKYYFQDLVQMPAAAENPSVARLSQRERATLEFLSKGFVDKEIAQAMGISPWTVHAHVKKIFERLNVRTRTEAVVRFLGR